MMKKNLLLLITLSCALLVTSGCSHFHKHKAKAVKKSGPILPQVSNDIDVKKDWVVRASKGSKNKYRFYKPAVNDDMLFTTDESGDVYAIDRIKAKFVWRDNIKNTIVTGPTYGDNKLYFVSEDSQLYAVNSEDGKLAWHVSLPNDAFSTPAYGAEIVVVKTTDGQVIAFNSKDGAKLWEYKESVPRLILRTNNPPKVEYPYVLAGFANGKVVALSAKDGRLAWEQTVARPIGFSELKRMVDVTGEIEVDGGEVFVASYHGKVTAINLNGGHVGWQRDISSQSGLAVNYHHVFVTDSNGRIWALNRHNGEVVWRQNDLLDHHLTAPTVIDDYIVVADNDGRIYWLADEDGHFVSQQYLSKTGIVTQPVNYKGHLYVMGNNGTLISLVPGKTGAI